MITGKVPKGRFRVNHKIRMTAAVAGAAALLALTACGGKATNPLVPGDGGSVGPGQVVIGSANFQ